MSSSRLLRGVLGKVVGYTEQVTGKRGDGGNEGCLCSLSPVTYPLFPHLRITLKHFHDKVVQAVIQELLKYPWELRVLNFPLVEIDLVVMLEPQALAQVDRQQHARPSFFGREMEKRMLVPGEFPFNLPSERSRFRLRLFS